MKNHKKILLYVSASLLAVMLIVTIIFTFSKTNSKIALSENQAIYKVKVTNTKVNDMSDWEVTGTTDAPDGAKLFATYGDSNDNNSFGINSATSTSTTSWSTVKDGKFKLVINPLTMHYEKEYKSDEDMSAYIFAITGLEGKISDYDIEPKINIDLKSAISKNVTPFNLKMSSSQADYYNNLGKSDSSSSSSSQSSASSSNINENEDPSSYKTGITYDQISRTPDDFKYKKMQFTGKVLQVMEDDDDTQVRLAVDGNYKNVILVDITKDLLNNSRVLEDDLLTVSGTSQGTTSYESTGSGKITIPAVNAKIINDQGKASDDYGE
ncbi:hypothetical protein B9J75_07100 [Leuconostoc citreum]|uniref:hypothetical protein n=1 Tax=Leuconostoc citreum TaxID=33964 RepID=UPI000A1EF787|nr:hypothetical protein [Leuconostoc citreum]OSP81393.1 hypothetical protein B9J75_07100 [Leuconostoc citreum]